MKLTVMLAAIGAMAFAANAQAEMARKEVVLDTGKGGIELKVSVPDFPVAGPIDFAGNPGIAKYNINKNGINVQGQEVAFVANMGPNTILTYKATTTKTTSKTDPVSLEMLAKSLLKSNGQNLEDAKPIETQFPLIKDGSNITYKLCSQPKFEEKKNKIDCTVVQVSASADKRISAGVMTVLSENEPQNANVEKMEKQAENAYKYMMMETKATIKQ